MDNDTFLMACVIGGCDYCPSPKGVSIKIAIKLVKSFITIEDIIENLKNKQQISSEFDDVVDDDNKNWNL